MLITRRAEFSASHACYRSDWSEERNQQVYGASANPRGHGHNYVLEVTLEGEPDEVTGMVMDLKDLKQILETEVVQPFDHRFLNHEVPPFDRVIPTPENITIEIWKRLAPHFSGTGHKLHQVRLWETEDLYVDYRGEPA
ncbi:MAG: 6-carboxytetrahydropterin synthase [Acidimicrobiia bacterium]|nr:6-carboxytetrahydropterin synthase [Acidimicrobiia bacterium]